MSCTLITGASGAVGSALVPVCLEDPRAEVKLLLRADSPQHLVQRLDELRRFWRWEPGESRLSERVEALQGDVQFVHWGLESSAYQRLTAEVTHVVHAAGNVRLNQPLAQARQSAVDGVRHAIQFVQDCRRHGHFQKLDLVSTVGVAGKTPGCVFETPYESYEFHNTYEQAKSEAENLLLQQMHQGFPATIHRPSMVVGDSRHGRIIHFQVFYHLSDFLSGLRTGGVIPDTPSVKLDIVPADYVARALRLVSTRLDSIGKIFHLCSGPERSWNLGRYTEELRAMLSRRGAPLPPLERLPIADFRRWLKGAVERAAPAQQRFLEGLPYLLDYLDEEQSFDNTLSNRYLSAAGLPLPPPEEYLNPVMDAYWNRSLSK